MRRRGGQIYGSVCAGGNWGSWIERGFSVFTRADLGIQEEESSVIWGKGGAASSVSITRFREENLIPKVLCAFTKKILFSKIPFNR